MFGCKLPQPLELSESHNITHYHSHTPYLIIVGKQRLKCPFLTKTTIPSSHLMPSGSVFLLVITSISTFSSQLSFPSAHHLSHYFSSFLIQPSFQKASLQHLLPKCSTHLNSSLSYTQLLRNPRGGHIGL